MRFREFVDKGWAAMYADGSITPIDRPLEWNFATEAIVAHLQEFGEGKMPKVLINVPPGCLKSTLSAVLYPAWMWSKNARLKFLFGTYSRGLTLRDAGFRLEVIRSEWYQDMFGDLFKVIKDGVEYAKNDHGGYFYSTSTDATALGWRCDQAILDDPEDPARVESEIKRVATHRWLRRVISSRVNPGPLAGRLLIQQRLDEQDATALMLSFGGWTHLRIPCEFDGRRFDTPIYTDPRTVLGQAISEAIYPKKLREERKIEEQAYGWSGKYQQDPVPLEGSMLKRAWFHRYRTTLDGKLYIPAETDLTRETRDKINEYTVDPWSCYRFMTVDLAFRKEDLENLTDPDYTVYAVWCVFMSHRGPYLFLLDLYRDRIEGGEYERIYLELSKKWKLAVSAFDARGYGSKIVRDLMRKGYRVGKIGPQEDCLVYVDDDTYARVKGCTPFMASDSFFIPESAPWLNAYVSELTAFPNVPHDDQCAATAYGIAMMEDYRDFYEEPKPRAKRREDMHPTERDAEEDAGRAQGMEHFYKALPPPR